MQRTVIAVDGLAGSGKTTLSRLLAERLGFAHLNSGLVYRAVGLLCLQSGSNVDDPKALAAMLAAHKIELRTNNKSATVLIDGVDVTMALRSPEVSEATSKSSRHPEVREKLMSLQRDAFADENMVAEGRDMGTVVFPDAKVKFFVEADPAVRIARRMEQLYGATAASAQAGSRAEQIQKEILERDQRDRGRSTAPTIAAADAILIDNSSKPVEKVVEELLGHVQSRGVSTTKQNNRDIPR